MPRTSLLSSIVSLSAGLPRRPRPAISRRGFLGAAAVTLPALAAPGWPRTPPDVAVVGAGLAGLTCAYRLKQAGIAASVFDANTRAGGRCWSLRGAFDEDQIVERGGELIDQGHTAIRHLAQELRLTLVNVLAAEKSGAEPFFYFDGSPYSYDDARRDLRAIWKKLHADLSTAGYPTTYQVSTERGRELDRMSIVDWIGESIPGGASSRLGQLLDVAYNIEYGAETVEQSSLNLLYLLGYLGPGQLRLFGPSNEKYKVVGGNDQIPAGLARALDGQIQLERRLVGVAKLGDGRYRLNFDSGAPVECGHVVLALPFSVLRNSVDLTGAGFRDLKLTAIQEQGMGQNSKFHLQFGQRFWQPLGCSGDSYADTGYQITWEVTRGQPGTAGILVNYTGGDRAMAADAISPAMTLATIEPVLPGATANYNGKSQLEYWPGNPLTHGSYSFWKVGQYTKFAGIEGEREGNCHFCGEHTSLDFQGYLNGAVETGQRAASEIISGLKG